jgi:FKBP-type peptidyl-prolyl cis-trans isomerase
MKSFLSSIVLIVLLSSCLGDSGPTFSEILASELVEIDKYLEERNINALSDVAGIRYTIDSLAVGHTPRYGQTVTFGYTGKFFSGTTFQSSTLTNRPVDNQLILGFQIGLPLIPNGSKATLYIPASFAYGSQGAPGTPSIPPNTSLIFNIKLKNIKVTTAEKNQLKADTIAIDNFLTSTSVANVVKDTSGLRYVITQQGGGPKPGLYHRVKMSFTGFLITNGAKGLQINSGTNEPSASFDSRVVNYLRGFQIGLQQLEKGTKATFFIPSGLGFGTQSGTVGNVNIPANANLMYEVELIDVLTP